MRNVSQTVDLNPDFIRLFHSEIEQHKQSYYYNVSHNLSALIDQDKKNYQPLNEANKLLGKFCDQILRSQASTIDHRTKHFSDAESQLSAWRTRFKEGGPFDTYPFASAIFSNLEKIGVDVLEELESSKEVTQAFLTVPHHIKSFFQFHILIPSTSIGSWSSKLAELVQGDPSLFYYVREFTHYHQPISISGVGEFKLARLKLLPEIVQSRKNPVIDELIKWFDKKEGLSCPKVEELELFADPVADNVFLSQGNTNYKKFLALFGKLSHAYSANTNHAYVK
jgi:hypothetical protein